MSSSRQTSYKCIPAPSIVTCTVTFCTRASCNFWDDVLLESRDSEGRLHSLGVRPAEAKRELTLMAASCQDKKPLRDEPSLSSGPPAGCRFTFTGGVTTASCVLLLLSRSSSATR